MYSMITEKPLYLELSLTAIHLNFLLDVNNAVSKYNNDGRLTVKNIYHLTFSFS